MFRGSARLAVSLALLVLSGALAACGDDRRSDGHMNGPMNGPGHEPRTSDGK